MKTRNLYVIAGPNGAGKTTFARTFLPKYVKCPRFVNPDLFFDNSGPMPRLVFRDLHGETTVEDSTIYERLMREVAS